jgi:multiple sugar transport system permease protein
MTTARRRFSLSLTQRRYLLALSLILPVILLRAFTALYPFVQTILFAFQNYNPAFPPIKWIGWQNFTRLGSDPVVQGSISFTIIFVVVSTVFQLIFGMMIASLLNTPFRLRGVARVINLIPWAVPMVVVAIGFRWMFDDQFGMIPDLLGRGLGLHPRWLIDPNGARVAILIVSIWKSTPFVAVLLLAGLQGVPQELYEAARIDGCSRPQLFLHITLPMMLPLIVTTGMFMLIWQLAVFDLPYTMTGGGPGFSTSVLAYKIFQEINNLNFGYASSIGMLLFVIVGIVGVIGLIIFRRVQVSL